MFSLLGSLPCCVARSDAPCTPRLPRTPRSTGRLQEQSTSAEKVPTAAQNRARLEFAVPPESLKDGPQPSAIAALLEAWISEARKERAPDAKSLDFVDDDEVYDHMQEQRKQARKPARDKQAVMPSEGVRYLVGTLTVADADGGRKVYDVGMQLKRFLTPQQRCIILHFFSNEDSHGAGRSPNSLLVDRGRKAVAMTYFEAATGDFHGIHIAEEHRGCGLMKPAFLYYVLFCREFGLPTLRTAINKKPLFASLFQSLGYQPSCADFPFLLFTKAATQERKPDKPSTAREFKPTVGNMTCVMPLPASKGRAEDAIVREGKPVENSWTFSLNFAMSQGLHVINNASATDAEKAESEGALRLYAKTAWILPSLQDEARREAALTDLLGRRATAVLYSNATYVG